MGPSENLALSALHPEKSNNPHCTETTFNYDNPSAGQARHNRCHNFKRRIRRDIMSSPNSHLLNLIGHGLNETKSSKRSKANGKMKVDRAEKERILFKDTAQYR